ncbi:MAG: glutamine synthetase type III, partial [Elusimicrobia bacterium]|nr:glutamine synthetase type III [Elusimicrobiota bacterium]
EKPFAGVNGSGKHLNWSLGTDTGKNLLSPGKTPQENLQFLIFLVATIKAVHDRSRVLRAAIASSGNDHRLGANEAPPAIISVFLGAQLTRVLEDLEKGVTTKGTESEWISIGIDKIPPILKDNTDRNRTSPFAFTGNKFEFRAVGSSFNIGAPIALLNAIVTDALVQTKKDIDKLLKTKKTFKDAALEVLRRYYKDSKAVCFEGNNYSAQWEAEAAKRKLPNLKTTPEALDGLVRKDALSLFSRLGVLSETEARSRQHIQLEKYAKQIDIEAKLVVEMVMTHYVPAAAAYQRDLASMLRKVADVLPGQTDAVKVQGEILSRVVALTAQAITAVEEIKKALAAAEKIEDAHEKALAYCHKVKPLFDAAREAVDALEGLVPDSLWPLPKYREMLFRI